MGQVAGAKYRFVVKYLVYQETEVHRPWHVQYHGHRTDRHCFYYSCVT